MNDRGETVHVRDEADHNAPDAGDESAVWRLLAVSVHDAARRLKASSLERAGVRALTPTTAEVLRAIVGHPGISVREVADAVMVQRPNASSAVAELRRLGLVEVAPDPSDRRRTQLRASREAVEGVLRLERAWGDLCATTIAGLDPADREALRLAVPALAALDRRLAEQDRAADAGSGRATN